MKVFPTDYLKHIGSGFLIATSLLIGLPLIAAEQSNLLEFSEGSYSSAPVNGEYELLGVLSVDRAIWFTLRNKETEAVLSVSNDSGRRKLKPIKFDESRGIGWLSTDGYLTTLELLQQDGVGLELESDDALESDVLMVNGVAVDRNAYRSQMLKRRSSRTSNTLVPNRVLSARTLPHHPTSRVVGGGLSSVRELQNAAGESNEAGEELPSQPKHSEAIIPSRVVEPVIAKPVINKKRSGGIIYEHNVFIDPNLEEASE